MHDEPAVPTAWLIDVCLGAVEQARSADLTNVSQRIVDGPDYAGIWPGEHYKLPAGFVRHLKPKVVVEIGTFRGSAHLLWHDISRKTA